MNRVTSCVRCAHAHEQVGREGVLMQEPLRSQVLYIYHIDVAMEMCAAADRRR